MRAGWVTEKRARPTSLLLRITGIRSSAPLPQYAVDILPDTISRFPTLDAARQELVVTGFRVAEVRGDRELNGFFVETLGGGRPPDAPAVFLTRVDRDSLSAIRWTRREQLADPLREPRHVLGVEPGTPFRLTLAAPGPCLSVMQTLGLGPLERLFFDQQSLALVPLARATPFQHHGGQRGVLAGAPRECGITRRQKHEVVEIRTGKAERATIACEKDERPGAEIFATFVAP